MKEEEDVIPEFWWLYRGDGKQWTLRSAHPPLIIPEFPLVRS